MLARQVTAVISSSGEPHRAGLRQTHLRQQHQHQHPSQATRDGGVWRPGNNHGNVGIMVVERERKAGWTIESGGSTEPPMSPDLATPLTPDSVLTTSPDLSSPPPRLWPGEEAVFSCRAVTHSWAFWGEDTAGALEHEGQDEEVDREREDESGKSPDSLLEDGGGGRTSGNRGCGVPAKLSQPRQMEHSQSQAGNAPDYKNMKSQSEGSQHVESDANSRTAMSTTNKIFEVQFEQKHFDQNQPIQAEQHNRFSKAVYNQDQFNQQSKGDSYRDTSSGQSSMDTCDAQTSEEARPSASQKSPSRREWFPTESKGIGDICLKPASVVSKDKENENSLIRKAIEDEAYWCTPPTSIQSSSPFHFPSLCEVDTRMGCSTLPPKEERKEDDLQPASVDIAGSYIGDIGLRSFGAKAGTLRPKKRKKVKSELGIAKGSTKENSKQGGEFPEDRSENRIHRDSTGDYKGYQKGSKTGTLRPKKSRLKVVAPEPQDATKPGMETAVITGDVLGEKGNKISTDTKELVNVVDLVVLKTKKSSPELSSEVFRVEDNEQDCIESARLDGHQNALKINMDWEGENFLNKENNIEVSDISILKPKTAKEVLPDKNKTMQENNLSMKTESGSCEDNNMMMERQGKKSPALETETGKVAAVDEEDIKTGTEDKVNAEPSVALDTLLSISEVDAVTNWLEGERGSEVKALEPLPLPLLLPPPIVRLNKSLSGSCSDQAEIESTGAESEGDSCSAAWPPPPSPLRLRLRGWPEEEEERMQGNGSVAGSQILAVHSLGLKLGLDPPSDPEDVEEDHNNDNNPTVRPKEQLKEEDCEEDSTGGPFEEMDMEICDPCYCYTKCWLDTFASFFCVSLL